MAIVQISQITQRTGNLVDLPQLAEAEFGWASDEKRLFIGKETPNENIEVLTSYSRIDFNQIEGSVGNLNISPVPLNGQVLAYDGTNWVNKGRGADGLLTLGDVANVKIDGGAGGYVLQTDGLGNLSWVPGGSGGGGGNGEPGGANTQVQFNNDNLFGGSPNFTWNFTTNVLTVNGNTNANNLNASGLISGSRLISNVSTGTAPLTVSSNTVVANLNADRVDGFDTSVSSTANTIVVRNADSNIAANNISGTLSTAAQPSITSLGNATQVTISGNLNPNANITYDLGNATSRWRDLYLAGNTIFIGNQTISANAAGIVLSGNVSLGNIAGTLTTAAQPNITSVGNLTGLNINGNLSVTTGAITGNGSGISSLNASSLSTGVISPARVSGNYTAITAVGTLSSLNVQGVSNLGPVSNLVITGGSPGQVLTTNGSGSLSWQTGGGGGGGETGATGATGATGPAGTTGATGPTGASGLSGDRYATTSNTSLTIGTGSKTLTIGTNLSYSIGQPVLIAHDPNNSMTGSVVSYTASTGSMTVNVNSIVGSGSYSFWSINLVGAVGVQGATGPTGATGIVGATGSPGYQVVSSLPGTCNLSTVGQGVYNTSDGKLYFCDGTNFIAVASNNLITGNIVASQIANVFGNRITGIIDNAGFPSANLIGNIVASQIANVSNTAIIGNIIASQIANVFGNTITGVIDNAGFPSANLIGNIVASQIANVANTAIIGQIVSSQIANVANTAIVGAIVSSQIANTAITSDKLAANSVIAGKIFANAVTATTIAAGAVEADKIAANAVTANSIAANSIIAIKIATGAVESDKILANAITSEKILANAVVAGKIAVDAVGANQILANAITAVKISTGAVEAGKIAANAIFADNITANAIVAGKIAVDAVGANQILANAITAVKINAGAVEAGKIAANAIFADNITANAIVAGKIAVDAVGANQILANAITAVKISANAITSDKIEANAVTSNKIFAGAITAGKLDVNAVTAGTIAANAVTATTIAANAIVAGKIDANAVTATTIAANAIVAGKIAANAVILDSLTSNTSKTYDGSNFQFELGTATLIGGYGGAGIFRTQKTTSFGIGGIATGSDTFAIAGQSTNSTGGGYGATFVNSTAAGSSNHRTETYFTNSNQAGLFLHTSTGKNAVLANSTYAIATNGDVNVVGNITATGTITPFTGSHDGVLANAIVPELGDILVDVSVIAASSVNDTLTEMTMSSASNQPAIGVYSGDRDPSYIPLPIGTPGPNIQIAINTWIPGPLVLAPEYSTVLDDARVVSVNGVGEGQINVIGENGNIAIGDLIVTSSVPGKGMKQTDDMVRSITVAKSREAVTFTDPTEEKLIACVYLAG